MLIDWQKYDLKEAKGIASAKGEIIKEQMVRNLVDLDLVDRGNLINGLKMSVRAKNGVVDRIQFDYEYYGKFFETGASNVFGNGVEIEPMHWRSEAIDQYVEALNQDFADYYSSIALEELLSDFPSVKLKM